MADRPELNPMIIEAILVTSDRILVDSIAESQGVVNQA